MREFEYKRKFRRVLSSPLVLLPLAVLLIFLARGTWNIYVKNRDSGIELRIAEERLLKLRERQKALSTGVAKLQTETGIESEIRDRLQMAKEGERAIVIVDAETDTGLLPRQQETFLQKIWNFFTIR